MSFPPPLLRNYKDFAFLYYSHPKLQFEKSQLDVVAQACKPSTRYQGKRRVVSLGLVWAAYRVPGEPGVWCEALP